MLPNQRLSASPIAAPYLVPDDTDPAELIDYEYGGIAIRDPSQGLRVQVWTFGYDGANVTAHSAATGTITLFPKASVTHLSGAFDQNMNPVVAFVAGGTPSLWWFDTLSLSQVFTDFPGISTPRVTMDDKRSNQTRLGTNDVIFAYLKGEGLYFRAQRDRYGIEYHLSDGINSNYRFAQMGMNSVNRLQFKFEPLT